MQAKNIFNTGYGKLLDAWNPPEKAGEPIGCIATTFTFSAEFFEEECLGRFLNLETDAKEDGSIYLIEREEKLANINCISVLVDQHHCKGSRNLRWDLILARPHHGCLHAKISILYWKNCLRVIISSANLTEDGYRRNQEVFGVLNYRMKSGEASLSCLKSIVNFLRDAVKTSRLDSAISPIKRWNDFLERVENIPENWGNGNIRYSNQSIHILPLFINHGSQDIFEQLNKVWPGSGPPRLASIYSPFFDPPNNSNEPAKRLWNYLSKRGRVKINIYVQTEIIEGTKCIYIHAPESLRLEQPQNRKDVSTSFYNIKIEEGRPFHAKGMWLENDRFAVYIIGSSNFTSAGLGLNNYSNLEANIVYIIDYKRFPKEYKTLQKSFIEGELIESDQSIRWETSKNEYEDEPGDELLLPSAFSAAIYKHDKHSQPLIEFTFSGEPPSGWIIVEEYRDEIFYSETEWIAQLKPNNVSIHWKEIRPPSGFWIKWDDSMGKAWLPVNVDSAVSLPPPEELKDLSLELLIEILTSARPLYKIFPCSKNKDKSIVGKIDISALLDPHKKVDTNQFLLQRTRRIAWALFGLQQRLEKPIMSEESLYWRLQGPIGAKAVLKALIKEARSEEEKAFLLTELALELYRINPCESPGCISKRDIKLEISHFIREIKGYVQPLTTDNYSNLNDYITTVFDMVLR